MSKPRLLVVGAFPPPDTTIFGGILTSCKALLDSSFPDKFSLVLVDSTQISNPPPGFCKRLLLAGLRFVVFCRQLRSARPEALLLFAAVGPSLVEKGAMAWVGRLLGIPALIFPRGGALIDTARSSAFQRAWICWAFRGAKTVLCQGPAWRRFAVEDLGFHPDDTAIIPNWTASNRLLSIGRTRSPRHREDVVRLLFLGWLEREKGIFELMAACSKLAPTGSFVLTIAGKGHAEEAVRRLVDQEGLSDRVHFAGWVQGAPLEQLMAESDVLVLPSWAEGLPNSMIEAMAAGLAVIVSAVGIVPDVVTDGREALLVPPKDVPALTRALGRIVDDHELRQALAERGHQFAKDHFTVEPAVERLSQAIHATMRRKLPGVS